jgi:hypothetical protein
MRCARVLRRGPSVESKTDKKDGQRMRFLTPCTAAGIRLFARHDRLTSLANDNQRRRPL